MTAHELRDLWRRLGAENRLLAAASQTGGGRFLELAEQCELHLSMCSSEDVLEEAL